MKATMTDRLFVTACVASLILAGPGVAAAAEIAGAADQPINATGPVKVFILSGQSNMTGRGTLGNLRAPAEDQRATLVRYIMEPENVEQYSFLYDGPLKNNQGWTVRDDVFISVGERHGGLTTNFGGFRNSGFGPELPIGHLLGDRYAEPVLLVKEAFGATTLSGDFRPPSSGGDVGDKYRQLVKAVHDAIGNLPEIVPGYDPEQGYEIVGFFWNQGEHDMNPAASAEYETNLASLINDLRKEFDAPAMKAVIAVTGYGGWNRGYGRHDTKEAVDQVIAAQFAVSERPEFRDAAVTVETRDFYRPQDPFGGNNQTIHWHANGESYWLVGEAMGRGMLSLLQ